MSAAFRSDRPRALITGLRGFTGRYLASELEAAGYRVFGTANAGESVTTDVYQVDLCDLSALSDVVQTVQPQLVAHLAAISFVAHEDVGSIYRVNVVGTRNLLEALSRLAVCPKAVLLASSANIYGNTNAKLLNEQTPFNPANDYAISKLSMEYVARVWMDRLPIVITRPFNYTGVGQAQHFLIPKIVSHFQRRAVMIELGNMDVERDFSDVRTVARVYRQLLELSPAGEIFNVCSGNTVSLREILALMSSISGHSMEARVNPAFVRANEVERLQGDNSKLRELIGEVSVISLNTTLRWMYAARG